MEDFVAIIKVQPEKLTDEERAMIEQWLQHNEPSTRFQEGPVPHVTPSSGFTTDSVLGS